MKGAVALLAGAMAALGGVGESAVITLIFPHGARSCAMGEVGVALADGEDVLYYNPAGLGVENPRWSGGAGMWFYEPLLPAFGIRDLWHLATATVYTPPWKSTHWGSFGFDYNYINMGRNDFYDVFGRKVGTTQSYEWVATLGWGMGLPGNGRHSIGMSAKYFHSALAKGMIEGDPDAGVASGFAFDAGYLWTSRSKVRLGVTVNNMGQDVFYVDATDADPIPFTVRLAVGFKDTVSIRDWPIVDFACETMVERECVRNRVDGDPDPFYKALFSSWTDGPWKEEFSEIQWHWGGEVTLFETVSFRTGILFDWVGERYEWDIGIGARFLEHFQVDWGYIHSPEGMWKDWLQDIDPDKTGATGARHGQWRLELSLYNMGHWERGDFTPFNFEKDPNFPRPRGR